MIRRNLHRFFTIEALIITVVLVFLFIFCVLPFFDLFGKILFSGPNESFSFSAFREVFATEATQKAILNTLLVSLLVTVTCLVTAVPLGWLLSRTNFPFNTQFRSLLSLPFAIPPYIGAIAWIFLANPTTGLLNRLFGEGFTNIYSLGGLVFVEASFLYTFIFLTTVSSLDRMDSSFEEAARVAGASPFKVFRDVSLPLLKPALWSGGLLVFLATAASFGVPALIGGPARIYLMTTQIYTLQKMGSVSGLIRAGAISTLLMLTALVIMVVAQILDKNKKIQTVSGKTARPSLIDLQQWKWPLFFVVSCFLLLVFILPLGGILLSSLSAVQGELHFDNLTFTNWTRVLFEVDETTRAIKNSLILGSGAATLAAVVGIFIAYAQIKTRLPGRKALDIIASIPYATPGTVVALAMIITFSGSFLGIFPSLYNTLTLILLAYFVKYLSFSVKTMSDGYRQIDDVLAEASRVSGASWLKTMTKIWLPLLRPALIASWFLVFMPAMSELTMTTLLTGPGLETIGTLIFQLQEYADASGGSASVLAVIVVAGVLLINFIVRLVSKGKYGL